MTTPMQETGTRAELTERLREMSEGWHHLCKDTLSQEAAHGATALESGHGSVKVGHTTYTVSD
jgi:hypothetical protein